MTVAVAPGIPVAASIELTCVCTWAALGAAAAPCVGVVIVAPEKSAPGEVTGDNGKRSAPALWLRNWIENDPSGFWVTRTLLWFLTTSNRPLIVFRCVVMSATVGETPCTYVNSSAPNV